MQWTYTSSLQRTIERWVPKSALITKKQYEKAQSIRRKVLEIGKSKYEKLIEFAKNAGLKVRKRMKAATILKKIRDAGLKYTY